MLIIGCVFFNPRKIDSNIAKQNTSDTLKKEFSFSCKFNSFNKNISVEFKNTYDSISECQRLNYMGFISKQDSLMPEIIQKVFEFYKEAYPDYYRGWSLGNSFTEKEIEKYLPKPSNVKTIKKFIEPLSIFMLDKQSCEQGTFGIYFDCTWDIKSSLGVVIRKWKVDEV